MSTELPAAVRAQDEAADAIVQGILPTNDPPAPPPAEPSPAPVAAAPEPPPAPVAPATEPEVNWQHKYLTLQGMYNTEVPALRAEVKALKEEIEGLKRQPAQPEPTTPPAQPAPKLVTDTDVENFGADLVDLIRRASREEGAAEKAALEAEIARLKGLIPDLQGKVEQVANATEDTRRAGYYEELAKVVPDFAAINTDQAFIGWLSLPDPTSGFVRQELLNRAFSEFDPARTAIFFNQFKQETGSVTPPAPPPEPPKNPLETQVSPGTSRAGDPPPTAPQTTWTNAQVQEFYNAVTRGDYRHDPEAARKIDAEIDRAFAEGRVRG